MKKFRPSASLFEPATYRIGIMGTLEKVWSAYCGCMTIEQDIVLDQYRVRILSGLLIDQAALVGVINTLYDWGYPIVLVERIEDKVTSNLIRWCK